MTTWTRPVAINRVCYYRDECGRSVSAAILIVAGEAELNAAQTADLIRTFKAPLSLDDILELHALRAQQAAYRDGATTLDGDAAETALAHCAIHYAAGLRGHDAPETILPPLPALTSRTKASLITTATLHRNRMLAATNDDMPLRAWARLWQISTRYMENLAR